MSHRIRSFLILVVAALVLPGAGCNLFETREPVISTGSGSQWERPISPSIIVKNLESAFEGGTFNDYERALTEDFVFVPDDSDVFAMDTTERPGEDAYADWDREIETITAETIALAADSVSVDLEIFSEDSESDGRRLLKYHYDLGTFTNGEVTHYLGDVWFRIRQEANGEWFIQEWTDVSLVEGAVSWGRLKGRSRP